jgi:hypothetical protein
MPFLLRGSEAKVVAEELEGAVTAGLLVERSSYVSSCYDDGFAVIGWQREAGSLTNRTWLRGFSLILERYNDPILRRAGLSRATSEATIGSAGSGELLLVGSACLNFF